MIVHLTYISVIVILAVLLRLETGGQLRIPMLVRNRNVHLSLRDAVIIGKAMATLKEPTTLTATSDKDGSQVTFLIGLPR